MDPNPPFSNFAAQEVWSVISSPTTPHVCSPMNRSADCLLSTLNSCPEKTLLPVQTFGVSVRLWCPVMWCCHVTFCGGKRPGFLSSFPQHLVPYLAHSGHSMTTCGLMCSKGPSKCEAKLVMSSHYSAMGNECLLTLSLFFCPYWVPHVFWVFPVSLKLFFCLVVEPSMWEALSSIPRTANTQQSSFYWFCYL